MKSSQEMDQVRIRWANMDPKLQRVAIEFGLFATRHKVSRSLGGDSFSRKLGEHFVCICIVVMKPERRPGSARHLIGFACGNFCGQKLVAVALSRVLLLFLIPRP